jgi:hypothetical protein
VRGGPEAGVIDSPGNGAVSVLLTNLLNQSSFTCGEIITMYFRRCEVES